MKKPAIIGLLVVVVAACLLLYWQHVTVARFDSDFRQQLAGVWWRQEAGMRCTNTVTADGSFIELSWFSHPDRTNTYRATGTWLVKDGHLIETVNSSSNSAEVTPHTGAARIIHSEVGKFVMRWPNSVETVWQKIIPAVTNAPHLHPTFTERLHQIQKRDATNKAPDHLTSPEFVEQQIQQSQPIKRPVVVLPPIPPEPTK